MKPHAHFIAGEWIVGQDSLPNINPSDLSDTVGHYAVGGAAEARLAGG